MILIFQWPAHPSHPREEGSFLVLLYLSQLPKPLPVQMGCNHVLSDPKTFGSSRGSWHVFGSAEEGAGNPSLPTLSTHNQSWDIPIWLEESN